MSNTEKQDEQEIQYIENQQIDKQSNLQEEQKNSVGFIQNQNELNLNNNLTNDVVQEKDPNLQGNNEQKSAKNSSPKSDEFVEIDLKSSSNLQVQNAIQIKQPGISVNQITTGIRNFIGEFQQEIVNLGNLQEEYDEEEDEQSLDDDVIGQFRDKVKSQQLEEKAKLSPQLKRSQSPQVQKTYHQEQKQIQQLDLQQLQNDLRVSQVKHNTQEQESLTLQKVQYEEDKQQKQELKQDAVAQQNQEIRIKKPAYRQKRVSSPREAIINLVKSYIGAGILAMPYSFNQGGYLLSLFVLLICSTAVFKCVEMLFEVADAFDRPLDFPKLAALIFGRKSMLAVRAFIVIGQLGICITYMIFFLKFFDHAFGNTDRVYDIFYMLLAFLIIAPMSLIDNVKLFSRTSILANLFILITLIAIIGYEINVLVNTDAFERNKNNMVRIERIPMLLGVCVFSFGVIGLSLTIRNSMGQNTKKFQPIFFYTDMSVTALYCIFSVLSVLALGGPDMTEIILFSLPENRSDVVIFQILYAIALILSYPLQLLPMFWVVEKIGIVQRFLQNAEGEDANKKRRFIVRIFFSFLISIIAFSVPRFALLINMIGSFSGSALQFVVPVIMHWKVYGRNISTYKKVRNIAILVLGSIGGIISFVFTWIELFDPISQPSAENEESIDGENKQNRLLQNLAF